MIMLYNFLYPCINLAIPFFSMKFQSFTREYTVRSRHSINGNYQFPIHLNSDIVQRNSNKKNCIF